MPNTVDFPDNPRIGQQYVDPNDGSLFIFQINGSWRRLRGSNGGMVEREVTSKDGKHTGGATPHTNPDYGDTWRDATSDVIYMYAPQDNDTGVWVSID